MLRQQRSAATSAARLVSGDIMKAHYNLCEFIAFTLLRLYRSSRVDWRPPGGKFHRLRKRLVLVEGVRKSDTGCQVVGKRQVIFSIRIMLKPYLARVDCSDEREAHKYGNQNNEGCFPSKRGWHR